MPPDFQTLFRESMALHGQGRFEQALAGFDALLKLRPDAYELQHHRSHALYQLGRVPESLGALAALLTYKPDDYDALFNRGVLLHQLRRVPDALASYRAALRVRPDSLLALNNCGNMLLETFHYDEALASFDRLLQIAPGDTNGLLNRAVVLQTLRRHDEAIASLETLLGIDPRQYPKIINTLALSIRHACDFARAAKITGDVTAMVAQARGAILPMILLGYSGDAALQRRCAELHLQATLPPAAPLPPRLPAQRDKIRIAYVSGDFFSHATTFLAAGLFERHDRSRFEISAFSLGPPKRDAMRVRMEKAFDSFHDVSQQNDVQVAQLLRMREIDIAVDLKGHTQGGRPGIFALRSCPVQVAWLGYPGTMGGAGIDYIIGDADVTPISDAAHFSESIVQLPGSYQVNDAARALPSAPPRRELGLPKNGFVFCSFNNNWKITAALFDIWMRLLAGVPGSVLWLLADNDDAVRNLRAEAQMRGVDPARLVFAPRAELSEHLARHGAADLSLDTLPCGAHTTASDALWMGLPHLTCRGASFAGRVAASLLTAAGLPELIAENLEDYESLALALARDPARLAALKQKLVAARATAPLFDTDRFCRHLEDVYAAMWNRALAGEPPHAFAVGADA
jgi:protein O-GlcNAc transferase